ncbi:MAG TPA: iron-sulfur cluster carrier protein MrpORP, partial [Deltaproteobacteria bacterium]|nr:iron-sulfur cluster carrier protein MrpORP [Deltaproteobacteria bacterium]
DGCDHSSACGYTAATLARDRHIDEAARIGQKEILDALVGLPEESTHCALLASNTLKAALVDFKVQKKSEAKTSCGSCSKADCSAKATKPGESSKDFEERQALKRRLCQIRHKILVLSGKGGVGKSTVAVNLAVSLSLEGKRVGLLDIDIHGPSVPKMLHLENAKMRVENGAMLPIEIGALKVMSIGLLLGSTDDAVIWRGPMKMGVIKQFLTDVEWGELDYLVVDSPPGTGDEPLSICQLIDNADGAIIVTTPQDVATADVRRSISFCRALDMPVLGVVENMSGFVCPKCAEVTDIFNSGGGEMMAREMGVKFLGRIPLDAAIGKACDEGTPFVHQYALSQTAKAFEKIIRPILALSDKDSPGMGDHKEEINSSEDSMRIALPVHDERLCMHFGHCEKFALYDIDEQTKAILKKEEIPAPVHEPGLLPRWLHDRGATVIIAGGMGSRAQQLFKENGIRVVVGAPAESPEKLVADYLSGILQTGENVCDH